MVVSGEATIRVAPDRAVLTLAVEARNKNPQTAQAEGARAAAQVMQALRAAKLGKDAVRTLSYSLQEEFDWHERRRVSRGYLASNSIEVRIEDVERVGEVLAVVVSTGATAVSGLRFDVKARDDLERQTLREAVANARGYAAAAALGAGAHLGDILLIEQVGGPSPLPRQVFARSMAADAKAAPPPIEAGQIEIRARARLTIELEDD